MANEEIEKEKRELEQKRMQRHAGGPGAARFAGPKESVKDFKGTAKRLLAYLRPQLFLLIVVFIMTIAYTIGSTYAPSILADIMDIIERGVRDTANGMDMDAIRHICVKLGILYAAVIVFQLVQQLVMIAISQDMVYDMRQQINEKLSRLPTRYFDSHSRGDILSRVSNDVENISMTLQMSLSQIVSSVVTIVSVLFFMLMRSALLTGVSLITVFLCFLMTKVIAKRAKGYFTEQWASTGDLNGQIEEMYTGHTIVKTFNRQKAAMDRFQVDNERLFQSSFLAAFISGIIQPAMNVLNNLNYVIVCVLGGIRIVYGQMSLGDVTAIIAYSKQLMMPITQTASIASTIQSTIASAERVFELLDEEEAPADHQPLVELKDPKVIAFEDVSFSYKPETKLIEHLNLTVRPGDKVAIVGPTGAGKTTLVNLLMRFYEVGEGCITIDGVDIRRIPRENLRSHIGMVLQDVWLFGGTIRENIAYGFNPSAGREATEEEILAAAKMAYVDHFVKTLADGYDTVLNDDATNISQGQKQLMTIARAFLSNPSILILDEATSSVDTRTEVLIQKAMSKLMEGRTSFVIAHRLSTIRDADNILVMNNGTIIEQGNHQDLLAKKGFYYDLYNSQFIGTTVEETPTAKEEAGGFHGGFPGGGFPGGKGPGGKFPGKAPAGKGSHGKVPEGMRPPDGKEPDRESAPAEK